MKAVIESTGPNQLSPALILRTVGPRSAAYEITGTAH